MITTKIRKIGNFVLLRVDAQGQMKTRQPQFDRDAPLACYAVLWTVALGRKDYMDNGVYDLEMSNVDTLNVQVWLEIKERKYKKFTRLT